MSTQASVAEVVQVSEARARDICEERELREAVVWDLFTATRAQKKGDIGQMIAQVARVLELEPEETRGLYEYLIPKYESVSH